MWKQGARSSALERAQAALSRRGRETSAAAHSTPRVISALELPSDLLSSHSDSSLSSVPGHTDHTPGAAFVPNPKSQPVPEVNYERTGRPLSSLDSGANRFLKKTPAAAAAQNQSEDSVHRPVSSSLGRGSQAAALSRLAQVENRFGKGVQKSPSRVAQMTVPDVPEEPTMLAQAGSEQPRRFVKSRPQRELREDGLLGQAASSERSEQLQSKAHLPSVSPRVTSPVPAQTPPELSPSPPSPSPSPPALSLSAASALGEVRSLEELFPVDEASEDTSEHFRINLMDLDELEPLQLERDAGKQEQQEEPREEDYLSDFESVIQTESLSEHFQDSAKSLSPPHTERSQDSAKSLSPPHTERSQDSAKSLSPPHTEHSRDSAKSLSPPLSDPLSDHTPRNSQKLSPPRSELSYSETFTSATPEARSPDSPVSDTPLAHSQMPSSKDKPGQTSHRPGRSTQHTAHRRYSPSLELLMESLRQQLALTSQFISSSREHHARVLHNLGPPNYTYTTLEDTQEHIWKLRASKSSAKQLLGKR